MKLSLLASLFVGINAVSLRESVHQELAANHPVCKEILDTWWDQRHEAQAAMTSSVDSPANTICNMFVHNWEACFEPTSAERKQVLDANTDAIAAAGMTRAEADDVRCASLGANSKICIQNNCNNLNEGSCTMALTGGLCFWYNKTVQGMPNVPGHGCYRNPCHLGNAPNNDKATCNSGTLGTPGLIECTWCKVPNEGMGCQATTANTPASCALINGGASPDSIYMLASNNTCQCTLENNKCVEIIDQRGGDFVPRY
mmetsp:Transcript_1802/g.4226  ORF Transcript_1802/g.4226 Transcript_1802/m.4226 type:complete len:257 (+) Transcript_1802:31-801(+)